MTDSSNSKSVVTEITFDTFGELLKYLRRRSRLTQRELSIATGYSESQISRLEKNERIPDISSLLAVFVPALEIEQQPDVVANLIRLAKKAHEDDSLQNPVHKNQDSEELTRAEITDSNSKVVIKTSSTEISQRPPTNLPLQLTTFVGRDDSINYVRDILLSSKRLVTLTGPGGVGKTRLAIEISDTLSLHFQDGVWFAELAPIIESDLVPQVVTSIWKLAAQSGRDQREIAANYLQDKQALIILDNCEHVIDACAAFVDYLLHKCPYVSIIATSREALNVAGEIDFPVPSMSIPPRILVNADGIASKIKAADIFQYDAISLFVSRSTTVRPDFRLSDENALTVAQICLQLDGIPLAIELAASRLKVMTLGEIANRIFDAFGARFQLLTSGVRTALPRHQTLRTLIDWSHNLLSESEQVVLRRLSVFVGGWTFETAAAVIQVESVPILEHLLDLLAQLVSKSLVVADTTAVKTRYHMLETIRQYASEKLQGAGEKLHLEEQFFSYWLRFLRQTSSGKLTGSAMNIWLNEADAEHLNIRAAYAWSRMLSDQYEHSLQMGGASWYYWFNFGKFQEGQAWLDEVFPFQKDASIHARLEALTGFFAVRAAISASSVGFFSFTPPNEGQNASSLPYKTEQSVGELLSAFSFNVSPDKLTLGELANECRELCLQNHHNFGVACAMMELSNAAIFRQEYDLAIALTKDAIKLYQKSNSLTGIGFGLLLLASIYSQQQQIQEAVARCRECIELGQEIEDRNLIFHALLRLNVIDTKQALPMCDAELKRLRTLDMPENLASVLQMRGWIALDMSEFEYAHDALTESVEIWQKLGVSWSMSGGVARSLLFLGRAEMGLGNYEAANRYFNQSLVHYREVGDLHGVACIDLLLAGVALNQNNLEVANHYIHKAIQMFLQTGPLDQLIITIAAYAEVRRLQGNLSQAAMVFGLLDKIDNNMVSKLSPSETVWYFQALEEARATLKWSDYSTEWKNGQEMTLEEAVHFALATEV